MPADIPLVDAAMWIRSSLNRSTEDQGQFADIRRQQNFLRLLLRDFHRDCPGDCRLSFAFARNLVDREDLTCSSRMSE